MAPDLRPYATASRRRQAHEPHTAPTPTAQTKVKRQNERSLAALDQALAEEESSSIHISISSPAWTSFSLPRKKDSSPLRTQQLQANLVLLY